MIVGLGNPGSKYKDTRHNVGYEVIAELAKRHSTDRPKSQFHSEVAEIRLGTEKCLLVSPLTYMNLSGKAIQAAIQFYKASPSDELMVICDDLNLDVGRIRIRSKGSAGGQNGIKDIIAKLGSPDFPRLRIGIGKPPPQWDTANYVLGKFDSSDRDLINSAVVKSADAIEDWVRHGITKAMNRFNAPTAKPKKKKSLRSTGEGDGDDSLPTNPSNTTDEES